MVMLTLTTSEFYSQSTWRNFKVRAPSMYLHLIFIKFIFAGLSLVIVEETHETIVHYYFVI